MVDDNALFTQLLRINQELIGILEGATSFRKYILDSDEKCLMAVFLAKACKTHQAVVLLAKSGYGEDAAILNRSLLNLLINARWIYKDPQERIPAYVDYDLVLKARLNRKIAENPTLLGKAQHLAPEFKRQQSKLDEAKNEATQRHNFNRHGWSGRTLRDMAAELGMITDYDSGYTLTSELEHSSVGAVSDYANMTADGTFQVSGGPSTNWVLESLGFAPLLLIAIAKLADPILELEIAEQLTAADTETLKLSGAKRLPDL